MRLGFEFILRRRSSKYAQPVMDSGRADIRLCPPMMMLMPTGVRAEGAVVAQVPSARRRWCSLGGDVA
jgi:hypothetical protein